MLKRSILTLFAGLLLLSATGCVEINIDTELKKDGSGKTEMEFVLLPSTSEILAELAAIGDVPDVDIARLANLDGKELQARVEGHGVKVKKFKSHLKDDMQTISFRLEYKDLEGYAFSLDQLSGEPGAGHLGVFDAGEGNLVLKDTVYDFPEEVDEEDMAAVETEEVSQEVMVKQGELFGQLMRSGKDLTLFRSITVPGDMVGSNGMEIDGRTSTWWMDESNRSEVKGNLDPNIVFSGKGLKIKPLDE